MLKIFQFKSSHSQWGISRLPLLSSALFTILLLSTVGCTAGMNPGLRPEIPRGEKASFSDIRISVGALEDVRATTLVGEHGKRELRIEGETLHYLRTALEEALRQHGIQQAAFGTPVLNLKLQEWTLDVKRDFTMLNADSSSSVQVLAFYPRDTLIYTGEFSGSAGYRAPVVSQARLEKLMGESLLYALEAMIEDTELQRVLQLAQ